MRSDDIRPPALGGAAWPRPRRSIRLPVPERARPLAWLVAFVALGVAVGLLVPRVTDPRLLLVGVAAASGLGLAAMAGRLRETIFAAAAVLVLVVPDVLINAGLGTPAVAVVAALVLLALLLARRDDVSATPIDLGVALIFLATAIIPALVSSSYSTIGGNAVLIVGLYVIARITARPWSFVVLTCLVAGAVHAVVAILWVVPATTPLVPFVPLLNGEPNVTSRATGLFNNPNTFGTLEAMLITLALWFGPRRSWWLLIGLCLVGLVLSGSREGAVGLAVAMPILLLHAPTRIIVPATLLAVVSVVAFAIVPGAGQRFDPRAFASDPSLLERYSLWDSALGAIGRSPIFGHGQTSGLVAVDQAYLNLLVAAGIIGAALWLVGFLLIALRIGPWPVAILLLAVGVLGNPFAGPTLALLLLLAGASHVPVGSEEPSSAPATAGT
jgi:O-antigen ligase